MWERDARSIPALREQAAKDTDGKVRARALGALTLLRDTGAPMVYLERLTSDPSPGVRRAAADAIGTLGIPPDRIDRLTGPLQKDADPMVRAECARALGKLGSRAAVGDLMYAVAIDPSPEVRSLAAEALSRLRAAEAEAILTTSAHQDPSPTVRIQAIRALAEISPVSSRDVFETLWREIDRPRLAVRGVPGIAALRGRNPMGRAGVGERRGFDPVPRAPDLVLPDRGATPGDPLPRGPPPRLFVLGIS